MRDQFTFFSAPLPPTLWSSSLFHISFTGESLKKMSAAFCLGPPFRQASPPADDCDLMGALTQRSIHTAAQDLFLQCDLMNIIWAPVLCQAWHSTRNTHTHTNMICSWSSEILRVCIHPVIFSKSKICPFIPSCFKLGLF